MDIITDDISKMNYENDLYNIQPMEDSELSKYSILNTKEQEQYAYENGSDIESINDEQYYFTIDDNNKVLQTKMPLVPITIETFETETGTVSFNYILVIFIIIVLIIVVVNYFFKECMSDSYNYYSSSSSSSSSIPLGSTLTFNSI